MIIRWDKGSYKEMIKKQLAILAEDSDSEVKEKAKGILSRMWVHDLIENEIFKNNSEILINMIFLPVSTASHSKPREWFF